MNTKAKSFGQYIFVLLSAILCLFFCVSLSFAKKKVEAIDISYAITGVSKNDSYFCLRDYDLIMTENQSSFGMCWIFSSTSALESFLARTTGMVYDFSEAWIALCQYIDKDSKTIGGGGGFSEYYDLMQKYGVLLESQFPQEMLFQIDTKNARELYEYYRDYANKDLLKNIEKEEYINETNDSSSSSDYILSIKEHLINYGALTYSYDDNFRFDKNGQNSGDELFIHRNKTDIAAIISQSGSWHQILITGWDDSISFTDKYGNTQTGVFICTNSWGVKDEETFYVSYDDICVSGKKIRFGSFSYDLSGVCGFKLLNQEFSAKITSTTSNMQNLSVKAYDLITTNDTIGYYRQSNIFYSGDDVSIDYRYYTSTNYKVSTRVEKDGQLFNDFDTFELNKINKTLSISENNIDSGEYIVWFEVDKNSDNVIDIYYPVTLMVYSGADFSDVTVCDEKNGQNYTTGDNVIKCNFNTILSTEQENIVYGFTHNSSICYQFNFGTLSNVVSHQKISVLGLSINSNTYTPATNVSYSKGKLVVFVSNLNSYSKNESKFKLTTSSGKDIVIKLITYKIYDEQDSDTKTYIFYNLNGGYNNVENDKIVALGINYESYTLKNPVKKGYQFAGWYSNVDFTKKIENNILEANDVIKGNLDNYADTSSLNKYFVMLYAKWEEYQDVEYQDRIISKYQYGDQLDFDFDLAEYGSNNYTYDVLSSLPNGISRDGNTLVGQITNINDIVVQIRVTDTQTNITKIALFTFKIQKRKVTYKVFDKSSKFGEQLAKLTCDIVEGSIIDDDNLGIKLSLPFYVTRFSPVADYDIDASFDNNNYDITFINEQGERKNAKYSILRTQFEFSFENIVLTYDGNNHHIDISVIDESKYENLLVEYSDDDNSYGTENIEVKNHTNGAKIIYIRVSAKNYDTQTFRPTITINQKQLDVTITQDRFVYNGQSHHAEVSVDMSEVVEDDRDSFEIIIADSKINAGVYTTDISSSNENYLLSITSIDYVITKAEPAEKNQNVPIVSDEISLAEKWGDLSLPTGYSWKYPEKKLDFGENYNIVRFVPSDTDNFNSFEKEVYLNKPEPLNTDLITLIAIIGIWVVVLVFIISTIVKSVMEKAPKPEKVKVNKNNKNKPSNAEVTIIFVTNSPIVLPVMYGQKRQVMQLPIPNRNYYEFGGWYTDRLFLHPYTNNGVEKELILYAYWKPKL